MNNHRVGSDRGAESNRSHPSLLAPICVADIRTGLHGRVAASTMMALALLLSVPLIFPAQPRQSADSKKGTGIVPSGVRLVDQMPASAPTNPFHFPKAVAKTLDNGVRVYVISDKEQPAVSIRLVLTNAGSVNDPPGKPGMANLAADMLTQGTATRTAEQIAEAIDFVGGSLSANADEDGTYIAVSVVKKDFGLAMELLSDIVLHPAFNKEELERRRQQALSNLQVQYSDPGYIADAVLNRLIYGRHPYGLPVSGTPESLPMISSDDLAKFRAAYFAPESALLAFAGDVKAEDAFAAAGKYLGTSVWPRNPLNRSVIPTPSPIKGIHVVLVDKPDANQTQIRIGRPGIRRNNPDYIPLYVANRIFGGGFNSRLSTEVRQKKGLTYGAYSRFDSHRLAGDFSASTFTRTEATAEATKLMMDLANKMSDGELGAQELDFARDYLAGVFPIQSETGEQVASRILTAVQYGLPADYNDTYQQKVLAVSPADVKKMAGRYFDVDNVIMVLVGNVKAFGTALRADFPKATFEELPFDQVDLLAPDLRKPKPGAGPQANPGR